MNAPISKIMTGQVITVDAESPLPDVYRIVKENSIHHLPVLRDGKLAGIISRTDLERVSFVNDPHAKNVVSAMWDFLRTENLMTRSPLTIQVHETIKDAAAVFVEGKIHALPVVDSGKVVGIVSTTDMIRYLLESMD
jgi:CBS domain-containing protein